MTPHLTEHAETRWNALIDRARTRQRRIIETFLQAGGPTLLGVRSA
jgi:hypothetical protein